MSNAVDLAGFRMRPAQGQSMGTFYAQAEHFLVDDGLRCPALGALVVTHGDHGEAAHRVVLKFKKAGQLMLVTKGDANDFVDRPMRWQSGVACRVWAMHTPEGLIWLKGFAEGMRSKKAILVACTLIVKCKLSGKSPLA